MGNEATNHGEMGNEATNHGEMGNEATNHGEAGVERQGTDGTADALSYRGGS